MHAIRRCILKRAMSIRVVTVIVGLAIPILARITRADERPVISAAATDEQGFLIHEVESVYQRGKTQIRVLLPAAVRAPQKHLVIYVLPVEANNEIRYGDGLLEVKKHNLHNKHEAIFVAPTFSHLPWYADHPTDPALRQEAYLVKVVLPFIEKTYPVQTRREGRVLLGFSKSGWGAWSLLLRNPELFGRAAAWDAPLMMEGPGKYGSANIFGTAANFANYQIAELLRTKGKLLGPETRLILTGFGSFRQEHEQAHALMEEVMIPHVYRDGPQRRHDWHSGWLPEAVELLAGAPPNR
jgi:hypothetical protein